MCALYIYCVFIIYVYRMYVQINALEQPVITVYEAAHNIKLPISLPTKTNGTTAALTLSSLIPPPGVLTAALTTLSHLTLFSGVSYLFTVITGLSWQYVWTGFAASVLSVLIK